MSSREPSSARPARTADLRAREPKAIHRALRVLEAVAELGPGATAKAVSTTVDYPAATTYRLLNLLVQDGYLVRTPDLHGFALGQKVTALAAYVEPLRIPQAVKELLVEMRSQVRSGVHLLRNESGRMVVVDADPVFPPPAATEEATVHPVIEEPRQMTSDAPTERPQADLREATDAKSGLVGIAATIRDEGGHPVAVLLLISATPTAAVGQREADLVTEFAQRLTPLLV